MNTKNRQKGFTILVAVVTASILLIVAISIGGIALKEQVLSTSNKETQMAFYAADTGMECAEYWDSGQVQGGVFNAQNPDGSYGVPISSAGKPMNCNGAAVKNADDSATNPATFVSANPSSNPTFDFRVDWSSGQCALVEIKKSADAAGNVKTTINSHGYNTCNPSLNRLERGIIANYGGGS